MSELTPDLERLGAQLAAAWRPAPVRRRRRPLLIGGLGAAAAAALVLVASVDLGRGVRPTLSPVSRATAATIPIASLQPAIRQRLHRRAITGPALHLLGTPFPGLDLYRAPSARYGSCMVEVSPRGVGGEDCNHAFTTAIPGIASSTFWPTRGTVTVDGQLVPPPASALRLRFVYGAATAAVATARLVDDAGQGIDLPLHSDSPGYVVFGEEFPQTGPRPTGTWLELLDASGSVLQRSQVQP
jgi:hypothetical protein